METIPNTPPPPIASLADTSFIASDPTGALFFVNDLFSVDSFGAIRTQLQLQERDSQGRWAVLEVPPFQWVTGLAAIPGDQVYVIGYVNLNVPNPMNGTDPRFRLWEGQWASPRQIPYYRSDLNHHDDNLLSITLWREYLWIGRKWYSGNITNYAVDRLDQSTGEWTPYPYPADDPVPIEPDFLVAADERTLYVAEPGAIVKSCGWSLIEQAASFKGSVGTFFNDFRWIALRNAP